MRPRRFAPPCIALWTLWAALPAASHAGPQDVAPSTASHTGPQDAPPSTARHASPQDSPPGTARQTGPLAPPPATARQQDELVELITLEPGLHLDIRYATQQNFVHRAVYSEARAFLLRTPAEALARVHRALRERGYGLLVFDGYRPWSVTRTLWDLTPKEARAFVADPAKGSRHNRGCAVDLSLFELATGAEVAMPSTYDETSQRAAPSFSGGTPEQRRARDLLIAAMAREGFKVLSNEWWHYDYAGCDNHPVLDVPFGQLGGLRRGPAR